MAAAGAGRWQPGWRRSSWGERDGACAWRGPAWLGAAGCGWVRRGRASAWVLRGRSGWARCGVGQAENGRTWSDLVEPGPALPGLSGSGYPGRLAASRLRGIVPLALSGIGRLARREGQGGAGCVTRWPAGCGLRWMGSARFARRRLSPGLVAAWPDPALSARAYAAAASVHPLPARAPE